MPLPADVKMREWLDFHARVGVITSGTAGYALFQLPQPPHLVINRAWVSIDGLPEDVAALAARGEVFLLANDKVVFSRPLDAVLITNVDPEIEDRLSRLERMMNVLVEQDSPAGEALRRLGGAKIESQSLISVNPPFHLTNVTDTLRACVVVHEDVRLVGAGVLRINVSVGGISAREVL